MRLRTRLIKLEATIGPSEEERKRRAQAYLEEIAIAMLTILEDGEWHGWGELTDAVERKPDDRHLCVMVLDCLREELMVDERRFPDQNRSFEVRLVEPGTGACWSELAPWKLSDYYVLRVVRLMREHIPANEWDDYSRAAIKNCARFIRLRREEKGGTNRSTWPHDFAGYADAVLEAAEGLA